MLNSPLALLLATGGLLGLTFPLAKLAGVAGISPIAWSLLVSLGAGLVLAAVLLVRRGALPLDGRHLRYYLVAGTVSNALPNLLLFSLIPRLGAGLAAIFLAFSPIFTLLLSSLWARRWPPALGAAGIALGCVGALVIVLSKGGAGSVEGWAGGHTLWLLLGLAAPLMLASGNLYRSLAWPAGSSGLALAAGTNLASALVLGGLALVWLGTVPLAQAGRALPLVGTQVAISALMFAVYFRLQRVGGPVYLSQIGYVAAAVGLGIGSLVLGESYGLPTWLGALVVAAGVTLTTRAQQTKSPT